MGEVKKSSCWGSEDPLIPPLMLIDRAINMRLTTASSMASKLVERVGVQDMALAKNTTNIIQTRQRGVLFISAL